MVQGHGLRGRAALAIDSLAARSGAPSWEVFTLADEVFERVAARGDERLARSA